MKRVSFVGLACVIAMLVASAGCEGEDALVGDSEPLTCTDTSDAFVDGTTDGTRIPQASGVYYDDSDGFGILGITVGSLDTPEGTLNIMFPCGDATRGAYDVEASSQREPACPGVAQAVMYGPLQDNYVADAGTVVVDEYSPTCVAGRFHTEYPSGDELDGWFRVAR